MRVLMLILVLWGNAGLLADTMFAPNKVYISKPYKQAEYFEFGTATQQSINSYFSTQYSKGIFSGTYLFYKNDSMLRGHLGYANYARKDSFLDDDIFQLASVSKTFTGTAIMILVQEGKIGVLDSVHWYLPELNRTNLTIKNLLSHTSGLPDYFYFDNKYWPYPFRRMTNADVIPQVNAQPAKNFSSPGRYYHYSNTNYSLLSQIVERVSGIDFRRFVKIRIMEPAGMVYSHIADFDSVKLEKYSVQGYEKWDRYEDLPLNGTTGDKGVYSSTYEMFLYDRMLRTNDVVHQGTKDLMWSPIALASSSKGMYYGLGWRVIWHNGHKWVYHNGWWKGFRTYFWRCLDADMCFVVLTNNVQGSFLKTAKMVSLIDGFDMLLEEEE